MLFLKLRLQEFQKETQHHYSINPLITFLPGQSLEEDPVTLVFLGYTDATHEEDHNEEDYEGMLTAERVIITEDGEEHVVEPETTASLQSPSASKGEQETQKKTQDTTLQDVPLNDNAEPETQREDSVGNDGGQKKCRCCSVM
uniref:Uncharacterized protein n=1 Tax=Poecilia latipinna TaxID=48699 RepID=A0A3B3VUC2_9TELE